MHVWQVQEAKAKLTQFMNEAKEAPQVISRRGQPEVVAMSIEKYKELIGNQNDIVSFFQKSPLNGLEIDVDRKPSLMRDVSL